MHPRYATLNEDEWGRIVKRNRIKTTKRGASSLRYAKRGRVGTVSILPKVLQGIPDAKFDGNAIWKSENEQFPYQFDYDGIFDPNRPNYESIVQTLYKSCK